MERFEYDVFISHAVEDKIEVANELCQRLERAGLRVWYSGNELSIGDRIECMIQQGLEQSRFGIAVLTPNYLRKNWTMREFYSMLAKERNDRKVIFPILHKITVDDLKAKDLTIADKLGISTDKGLDHVVNILVKAVHREKKRQGEIDEVSVLFDSVSQRKINKQSMLIAVLCSLLISISGFAIYNKFTYDVPPGSLVNTSIEERIDAFLREIELRQRMLEESRQTRQGNLNEVGGHYARFASNKAPFKNTYSFDNGMEKIYLKNHIEPVIKINLGALGPENGYGMYQPKVIIQNERENSTFIELGYVLVNCEPLSYEVESKKLNENYEYLVEVQYKNPIRQVAVDLRYSEHSDHVKTSHYHLAGFKPLETYVFEKEQKGWELKRVE